MKSPLGLEARLPVMDILKEAAVMMWNKRQHVLRLFLPVIVLMGLIDLINMLYFSADPAQDGLPVYSKETVLAQIFVLFFTILMATTAHRFTLMDSSQWPATALHLPGRAEFRYLVRGIQIGILSAFIVLLFTLLGFAGGKESGVLFMFIGVLFASYFLARLSVTLPEIALGYKTPLSRAWAMSKGNGNSLVVVVLVLPVVLTLPLTVLAILAENVILQLIGLAGSYLATLLSLIVMSLSYQFLLNFYEPDHPLLHGGHRPQDDSHGASAQEENHSDDDQPPRSGSSGGFDA